MSKLLTICIPTHQGRAGFLMEAVHSVLDQLTTPALWSAVEISISDNASEDGTADLVRSWQALYGDMVLYNRFAVNQGGFPNFDQAVNQATGAFCWFLGSDDTFPEGAIARAVSFLEEHPEVAGFSVNKANYTFNMRIEAAADHPYVLPEHPEQYHYYDTADQIIANCAYAFAYMSAHIVRRAYWQEAVAKHGTEYIKSLRHFAHSFVLGAVARDRPQWAWLPDAMVKQRMQNACTLDESEGRYHQYLSEVLEDMDKVWFALIPQERLRRSLRNRFFVLYLNPLAIHGIKISAKFGSRDDRPFLRFGLHYFWFLPRFWFSLPLFLIPQAVYKAARTVHVRLGEPVTRTRAWVTWMRGELKIRSRVLAALGNAQAKQALREAAEKERASSARKAAANSPAVTDAPNGVS